MLLRAIAVHGFAGLPEFRAELPGRLVRVGGAPAATGALFDALTLAFGAFSVEGARAAWRRLGFPEVELTGEPMPESVRLPFPEFARAMLDPGGDRTLKVELEIELDPPQFRLVRQHAARDPELGVALGDQLARLSLTLGWAFTPDFTTASCGVLSLRLGELSPRPGEPCLWREELLRSLAGRGQARWPGEHEVERFAAADRSPDPRLRRGFAQAREALANPPFSLGELQLVEATGRWLAVGRGLTPLRVLGPGAMAAVSLVQWVFLDEAEILLMRAGPGDAERLGWLERQVEDAGSPLEQLFVFGDPGPHDLVVAPRDRVLSPGLALRR